MIYTRHCLKPVAEMELTCNKPLKVLSCCNKEMMLLCTAHWRISVD